LGEIIASGNKESSHYYKVVDDIMEKELGSSNFDPEVDVAWHKETHEN